MATIKFLQPEGLSNPGGYTHVVTVRDRKLVFISGQVAYDAGFELVGEEALVAQTRQVMKNLAAALDAAGASFDDLVKLTIFVVNYQPSFRDMIISIRDEFFSRENPPASSLVGVQSLARPELLIEIKAIAAV